MLALVTNDDGIDSDGLRVLAEAAVAAGLDVLVAAPATEYSGASAAMASVRTEGQLAVHERVMEGVDARRVVAVEASPAFIVFAALGRVFDERPDVILSGINIGPNTGHNVLHSGTVGAALTGGSHGVPSVAISMAAAQPRHWDTAAAVAERVIRRVARSDEPVVLNVNVPDVPPERLKGLRPAPLAPYGAVQARLVDAGQGMTRLAFEELPVDRVGRTDASLLAEGWATVTALRGIGEDSTVDLDGVQESNGWPMA